MSYYITLHYIILYYSILFTLIDLCVSSLRRAHDNIICIVPIVTDDPRRDSFLHRIRLYNVIVYDIMLDYSVLLYVTSHHVIV